MSKKEGRERINSRHMAMTVLSRLETSESPLPILFDTVCNEFKAEGNDRAFAMNIVYGILRQQEYLEFLISTLSHTPLQKLHPLVRKALLVGLFQIVFLQTPDSAAVNETVKALKLCKIPRRLHGFVNGILREAIRKASLRPDPENIYTRSPPLLNHPRWMTGRWKKQFGNDVTMAICKYNNTQPPLCLRVNANKLTRGQFLDELGDRGKSARQGRYSPDAVILEDNQGKIEQLPGYDKGFFQVQGESAQLATSLLGPIIPQGRYLDGCAGLGGKTGHILELLEKSEAHLVAVEPEIQRSDLLRQNIGKRYTPQSFTLFTGNLQQYRLSQPEPFHGILIDAPCSGTGILARQPDIRWKRTYDDILRYSSIQLELVKIAAELIVPGGTLVYATCSLEREENVNIIEKFLQIAADFSLDDPTPFLPKEAACLVREGCFAPRPSDKIDGFFAARLVRRKKND